jgi:hypothetical protein
MQVTQYPKTKPFRSKKAREWFRALACDCCGESRKGYVTGHHEPLNGHGTSSKGPDDEQVPLCFKCHRIRTDDLSRVEFYKTYTSLPFEEIVSSYKKLLHQYLDSYRKQQTGPC